ncbi:MAG: M23 family metallopeptidase [Pleurocapsa minor GSE-CHR-MK-17-07R]|jgi:murein DD-endopeptidase MepM/ murein hydrolase activator NlpD|nr:M23 family metallopeptidase [Pleurocapsa minor GSE-CHR-MK 17-07R]
MSRKIITIAAGCLLLAGASGPTTAQAQCGFADGFAFPVDTSAFSITQDYAVQSGRFQGRYHTGEDWFIDRTPVSGTTRGTAYGENVRAVANGRVVLSEPNAWGDDGGVILIEHTLPDNSIAYSMYGHITDETGIAFPANFACVRTGDVLAAVDDVRPVPHLHFEIREGSNLTPGPGYVWLDPESLGYRRPGKFLINWNARLHDAYRWHIDLADESGPAAPPIVNSDNSLIYLDRAAGTERVVLATSDGRVLWRTLLSDDAVGLDAANADIVFADGGYQPVFNDGTLGTRQSLGYPVQAVYASSPDLLVRTGDGALQSLTLRPDAQTSPRENWRIAPADAVLSAAYSPAWRAWVTQSPSGSTQFVMAAPDGSLIDRAFLSEPAGLAAAPDGSAVLFSRGGLWNVDASGTWTLRDPDFPFTGGEHASVALDESGRLFVFDGLVAVAFNADGQGAWQTAPQFQPLGGRNQLIVRDNVLLLVSSYGDIIAWRANTGAECARTRVWGDWRTGVWFEIGADGILRAWIGDQIIGYDWRAFTRLCR